MLLSCSRAANSSMIWQYPGIPADAGESMQGLTPLECTKPPGQSSVPQGGNLTQQALTTQRARQDALPATNTCDLTCDLIAHDAVTQKCSAVVQTVLRSEPEF